MTLEMPDTSNAAIGRRLVAVREAKGLTQAFVASQLDVSYQRWGLYERGQRFPPPDMLARFWQLTGATSDFVLFGHTHALPLDLAQALRRTQAPSGDDGKKKKAG